jgi:hypothetical protein
MQKLPVYLYSNLFNIQLDLDAGVREVNDKMYQRELVIQKGLKNKIQLQFKNSDQKNVRVAALGSVATTVTTSTNVIQLADAKTVKEGMYIDSAFVKPNTFVSNISNNTVTISNLDPVFDPELGEFLSPIIAPIPAGTELNFKHNFVFSMFDSIQQRMVLQKSVEILDDGTTTATRGLALLELTETDTRELDKSFYTFGVTLNDKDGTNIPSYSNTYYGINGTVKIAGDLWPTLKDSIEITQFQIYINRDDQLYEFYTGNLKAYPELTQTTTAAMYFDNFTGTVLVQATLENSPGNFANYATVETKTYTNFTGVDYANIEGSWTDVRIKWIPAASDLVGNLNYYSAQMPGNPTTGTAHYPNGKIDKVLYRN